MPKRLTSGLPWGAAIVLYLAGIVFIYFQTATLQADWAKVAGLIIQGFLAGAAVHGAVMMRAALREAGEAARAIRGVSSSAPSPLADQDKDKP